MKKPSPQIDSRNVEEGDIFVAIDCPQITEHIIEALSKGASFIIVPSDYSELKNDRFFYADDVRLKASELAAICYPESPENCVAVTGTNGKSSVVHFFSQLFYLNGIDCANLGTNGLFVSGIKEDYETDGLTTPSCLDIHKILSFLKTQKNVDYLAFEASSHAIHQKRIHSVKLKAAAFTNLASDHLDYHKTKEEYFSAKQKLFTEVGAETSVFSMDDDYVYSTLMALPHKNVITFGLNPKNDINAQNIKESTDNVMFDLSINGEIFKDICIPVFGKFQVMNILCSIALASSLKRSISSANILKVLPQIKQLEGRMEHICSYKGGDVYVDFAHTAEAFRNCLLAFKRLCSGRLIAIFGCGGDRDKSKRKIFGEIAGEIADINIITDDNPRTEDPQAIRSEIIMNCKNAVDIGSRKEAIEHAFGIVQENDFVVIIGKGHETKQIYKDETFHFNDKETVLEIVG